MNIAIGVERMGGCEYIRTLVPYMELRRRKSHLMTWIDRIVAQEGFGVPLGTLLARDFYGNVHPLIGADAFVIQRCMLRSVLDSARLIQSRGTKIVYEVDDNFHAMPSSNPAAREHGPTKEPTMVLNEFLRMADLVTVSTEGLRREYAPLRDGKPIAVCPNALDDAQFHRRSQRVITGEPKRPGEIRIGWAGSGTHFGDLQIVLGALTSVMDEFPTVKLVFIGADMRGMMPDRFYRREMQSNTLVIRRSAFNRVEFAGAVYTQSAFDVSDLINPQIPPIAYYDLIDRADLDIAIAPIAENVFNAGKSWIKALEYGMLGIPMVLSDFGPYREFVRGAGDGPAPALLAGNATAWKRHLGTLVRDAAQRAQLATAARRHIAQHHLISRGADAWEDALRTLSTPPAAVPA